MGVKTPLAHHGKADDTLRSLPKADYIILTKFSIFAALKVWSGRSLRCHVAVSTSLGVHGALPININYLS